MDLSRIIETCLRADVLYARSAFDAAAQQRKQLLWLRAEHGAASDGVITLQEAAQLHATAIKRYALALSRFSDFVVTGKLPVTCGAPPAVTSMMVGREVGRPAALLKQRYLEVDVIPALQWTIDDYVFAPQLDADHQKLSRDLEAVRQAIALGAASCEITLCTWKLSRSLSVHLASEERMMRRSRYPAYAWHEGQHHAGRTRMATLAGAVRRKDDAGIADALQGLAHWLRGHLGLADRMFAAHLRNDVRERLAS